MYKLMQKIPGGIIILPLLFVSIIASVFPQALTYDGMTAALFSGDATTVIVAALIFLAGSQLHIREIPAMLLRGGVLSAFRILIAVAAAVLVNHIWGADGFLGISLVAITVSMCSCDPGIYLAVVSEHGDSKDSPVFILLNLVAVPALPILILGASSGTSLQIQPFLSTLVPFAVGLILGNLDEDLRDLLGKATPAGLLLLGINLGAVINWNDVFATGVSGLLLTGIYFVVSLPILLAADKVLLRRPGYASVSMTSLSGVSIIMPAAIGAALPQFAPYAAAAAAQISVAVIVSKIVTIPFNALTLKFWGDAHSLASTAEKNKRPENEKRETL